MNNIIRYKFFYIPIFLLLFTFLIFSCSLFCDEDSFQNYDNLREITHWTVDTLELPGVEDMYLRTFWGSSADDLYVVGSSSEGLIGGVWHYDGNEWTPVLLHTMQGGNIDGWLWVKDIWGFGEDDVYIVGVDWTYDENSENVDSSFVVHYNGLEWIEIKVDNYGISSIGGTGPDNIWLGGILKGNISHWNGSKWINYNNEFPENVYRGIPSIEDITTSNYYKTFGILNNYKDYPYLISTEGTDWTIEHTFAEVNYYKLHLTNDGILYLHGFFDIPLKIWRDGGWDEVTIEEYFYPGAIFGLDNNDLLISGIQRNEWKDDQNITRYDSERKVFHFNGINYYQLKGLDMSGGSAYGIWSDGKEIFIASQVVIHQEGVSQHKTTIIHGR